jgi:hypothetical protein
MSSYTSNRSIIYWSESGGAKTSQIAYLADRIWRQHHKRSRVISADNGSLDPIKPEIEKGMVEVFVVPPIDNKTIAIFRKLSLGWWPDMAKLREQLKIVLQPPTLETYREFGMLAWDGMTAVSDRIFRDFQQSGMRLGRDEATAALEETVEVDVPAGAAFAKPGTEKIFAATQSMYLFTQKEVRMLVDNANTLPFNRTYWTALESKGEEVVGRDTIYGPMLAGSAATSKVPAWFGDCFHGELMFTPRTDKDNKPVLDTKTKVPILDKSIRVYYNDHQDPKTGFKYKAKPRVPPRLYGELEKKFPGGFFDLTPAEGIDKFLDFEDELFARAGKELEKSDFDLEKFRAELGKGRPAQVAVPAQIPPKPSPPPSAAVPPKPVTPVTPVTTVKQ